MVMSPLVGGNGGVNGGVLEGVWFSVVIIDVCVLGCGGGFGARVRVGILVCMKSPSVHCCCTLDELLLVCHVGGWVVEGVPNMLRSIVEVSL